MTTLKEARRLSNLRAYYHLDYKLFLNGKRLLVENVRSDSVQNVQCLKVDIRIKSDDENHEDFKGKPLKKNIGKVFTIQIDNTGDHEAYHDKRERLADAVGHYIQVNVDDFVDSFIYQGSCLIVRFKDIKVLDELGDVNKVTRKDRFLNAINHFLVFNNDLFFKENEIAIRSVWKQGNKELRFLCHIGRSGVFEIKLPVDDVEELPFKIMMMSGNFRELVQTYEFEYDVLLNHGNSILLGFKSITFRQNVLGDTAMRVGKRNNYNGGIETADTKSSDLMNMYN